MSRYSWTSFQPRKGRKYRWARKRWGKIILLALAVLFIYYATAWLADIVKQEVEVTSDEVPVSDWEREGSEIMVDLWISFLGREMPGISSTLPPEFTFSRVLSRMTGSLLGVDWMEPQSLLAVNIAGLSSGNISSDFSSPEGNGEEEISFPLKTQQAWQDNARPVPGVEEERGDPSGESSEEESQEEAPREREEERDLEILIYHSHVTETFVPDAGEPFTENMELNVSHLGRMLAQLLEEEYGITTRHNQEIFDIPRRYAYREARPVIREIIEENPDIGLVVDLHRDGMSREVTTSEVQGRKKGKLLFIIGTNHENWYRNHSTARVMKQELEDFHLVLSRGIREQPYVYNQDLHPRSVLVEVGGHRNSLEEVERTVPVLAEVLAHTHRLIEAGEI